MNDFKYPQGFVSLSKADYDAMWGFSPELAHHFERCVGMIRCADDAEEGRWGRHSFVYDPKGKITINEFQESVDYVKENIGPMSQTVWYQGDWKRIMRSLDEQSEPFIFAGEPVSLIFDRSEAPYLILIYARVMLGGSRTYGLTSRGKLVPLSHEAHYAEAPYSEECFDTLNELFHDYSEQMEIMENNSPFCEPIEHVRFFPKSKAEFIEGFPNGNVEVIKKTSKGYFKKYVASVKGRKYYDSDAKELSGVLYIYRNGVDYELMSKEHIRTREAYENAVKQCAVEVEKIEMQIARCRRAAKELR